MFRVLSVRIPLERLHEKFAVQLNDTHPAIAVAELMRLLVDVRDAGDRVGHYLPHDGVYEPHAAARGARVLAGRCSAVLPRHLEIIYEIPLPRRRAAP
jgi:starch phosphorylase